jgi:hypothetical protein
LPLLRTSQVRTTIPDTDAVVTKHPGQSVSKLAIPACVGDKDLSRFRSLLAFQVLAGVSSNPCST